jgi:hypothetical protein
VVSRRYFGCLAIAAAALRAGRLWILGGALRCFVLFVGATTESLPKLTIAEDFLQFHWALTFWFQRDAGKRKCFCPNPARSRLK